MTTTATPRVLCGTCGYLFTNSTGVTSDTAPEAGDFSICINCGAVLIFDRDLRLRIATEAEITEVMQDEEARRAIQRAQTFIAKRGPIKKIERMA